MEAGEVVKELQSGGVDRSDFALDETMKQGQ
jgi:hypothetical protein